MPASHPVSLGLVPVREIDLEDCTYAIAPAWFPLGSLTEVIARYGVVSPISLEVKEDKSHRVISGFRRLRAAVAVGLDQVPAIVRRGDQVRLFLEKVTEEAATRPLHLLEKALAARKLIVDFRIPQREVTGEFLPLLGVKPNHFELRRLQEIAQLPREVQELMVREALQPEIALCVARWESGEQSSFLTLFVETKPGFNHQKELCTLLDELRARDGEPVGDLIGRVQQDSDFPADAPASERLQAILARLRAARYPRLSEQEARYLELKARLRLPPGLQFQVPAFFEGNKINLAFSVASPAELRETADRLHAVAAKPELEEIFELL